jgi:hypothetical protein
LSGQQSYQRIQDGIGEGPQILNLIRGRTDEDDGKLSTGGMLLVTDSINTTGAPDATWPPLTVVTNWTAGLKK